MNVLFFIIFLGSIISFIVFLFRPKYRKKKYLLGTMVTLIASFILFGVTAPETTTISKEAQAEQEKLDKKSDDSREKEKAEEQARQEQESREKAEAEEQARQEQESREKAEAEEQARQEQESREKAEAEEQARQERESREKAEAEEHARQEQLSREAAQVEQNRQQQAAQTQNQANTSGITGYCKDGTPATGNPSARGKANSCYGHGGWVR